MPDVSWTIGTADDGDVTASALLGELYTPVPGQTIRPTFRFASESTWTILRDYVQAASEKTITAGLSASGKPYYREDLSEFPNVTALTLAIDPAQSNGAAVWVALTGGTDRSNAARSVYDWELQCTVLAELSTYADRTALENALASPIL